MFVNHCLFYLISWLYGHCEIQHLHLSPYLSLSPQFYLFIFKYRLFMHYTYRKNELTIYPPYEELWSILRSKGKYIIPPYEYDKVCESDNSQKLTKILHKDTINIIAKVKKDGFCRFCKVSDSTFITNLGYELQLSQNYDYEIKWNIVTKSKITIGFYSPY